MKTSKKILITFISFIFGVILILYISSKLDPRRIIQNQNEVIRKEQALEKFTVLVAERGARIQIDEGSEHKMILTHRKNDGCVLPNYKVYNDTLSVYGECEMGKARTIEITAAEIKSIIIKKNAFVNWMDKPFDSLTVHSESGNFWVRKNKTDNPEGTLILKARKSNLSIHNTKLEAITLELDSSLYYSEYSRVVTITGSLRNHSEIKTGSFKKLAIEADETSKYSIFKR